MSDKFARIEFTNLYFMLREINGILLQKHFTNNLLDMTEKMKNNMDFRWDNNMGKKWLVKKYMPKPMWNFCRKIYHGIKGQ